MKGSPSGGPFTPLLAAGFPNFERSRSIAQAACAPLLLPGPAAERDLFVPADRYPLALPGDLAVKPQWRNYGRLTAAPHVKLNDGCRSEQSPCRLLPRQWLERAREWCLARHHKIKPKNDHNGSNVDMMSGMKSLAAGFCLA